jgi:beta-barrel assembly-enhancing protease
MRSWNIRGILGLSLLILSGLGLASCGSAGDTVGSLLVTDADEVEIGQQFDTQLQADRKSYPVYDLGTPAHRKVKAYVDSVVRNILSQVPASERPAYFDNFKVTLVDTNIVNAFAVPGGFVYVYTGILDTLRNEAELGAVLGHEMTHVIHHHYRSLLVEQYGIQAIVGAAGGDSSTLAHIATSLLSLKLSRDHEADADKNGTTLAGAAGYNPLGVADFFGRMPDGNFELVSDHPSNSSRVATITAQVKASSVLSTLAYSNGVVREDDRFQSRYQTIKALVH